jgi:hypothetical protein
MKTDNYALWLLKNALRDEITYRQQACQVLDGIEPHHTFKRDASLNVFSESLRLADKRIPELLDAINQIENA